jgi:heme/copper-type cytochrome/quinol oxidase subunit 4
MGLGPMTMFKAQRANPVAYAKERMPQQNMAELLFYVLGLAFVILATVIAIVIIVCKMACPFDAPILLKPVSIITG